MSARAKQGLRGHASRLVAGAVPRGVPEPLARRGQEVRLDAVVDRLLRLPDATVVIDLGRRREHGGDVVVSPRRRERGEPEQRLHVERGEGGGAGDRDLLGKRRRSCCQPSLQQRGERPIAVYERRGERVVHLSNGVERLGEEVLGLLERVLGQRGEGLRGMS